jgi:hypothetical protein
MIGHIDIGTEELFLKLGYRLNSHNLICIKSSYMVGWFLAKMNTESLKTYPELHHLIAEIAWNLLKRMAFSTLHSMLYPVIFVGMY